jgi:hypothetical protein
MFDVAQREENFLRCAHLNGQRRNFTFGYYRFRLGTSGSRNKGTVRSARPVGEDGDVKNNTTNADAACIAHMTISTFFVRCTKNLLTSQIQSLQ